MINDYIRHVIARGVVTGPGCFTPGGRNETGNPGLASYREKRRLTFSQAVVHPDKKQQSCQNRDHRGKPPGKEDPSQKMVQNDQGQQ